MSLDWQHLGTTRPIARKKYSCLLCESIISSGEKHVHRVGITDGEFSSFRMHETCERLTQKWDDLDWECFDPAEFRKLLDEH